MRKDIKYIQLPPIPEDIEIPVLEAIWLFARMNQEERKDALAQLQAMLGDEETDEMDYETIQDILDKYANEKEDEILHKHFQS